MWLGVLIVCFTPFLSPETCNIGYSVPFITLNECKASIEVMVRATKYTSLGFCIKSDGVEGAS